MCAFKYIHGFECMELERRVRSKTWEGLVSQCFLKLKTSVLQSILLLAKQLEAVNVNICTICEAVCMCVRV